MLLIIIIIHLFYHSSHKYSLSFDQKLCVVLRMWQVAGSKPQPAGSFDPASALQEQQFGEPEYAFLVCLSLCSDFGDIISLPRGELMVTEGMQRNRPRQYSPPCIQKEDSAGEFAIHAGLWTCERVSSFSPPRFGVAKARHGGLNQEMFIREVWARPAPVRPA